LAEPESSWEPVTSIEADTRPNEYDIITVCIKGFPVGRLTVEKNLTMELARRLLPGELVAPSRKKSPKTIKWESENNV